MREHFNSESRLNGMTIAFVRCVLSYKMPINIPRSYGLSPSERSACHISNIFLKTLELANNQREVRESYKLKYPVHTLVCIPKYS